MGKQAQIHTTVPLYSIELSTDKLDLKDISGLITEQRWFDVVIASIRSGDSVRTSVAKANRVIEYYKEKFTDVPGKMSNQ